MQYPSISDCAIPSDWLLGSLFRREACRGGGGGCPSAWHVTGVIQMAKRQALLNSLKQRSSSTPKCHKQEIGAEIISSLSWSSA